MKTNKSYAKRLKITKNGKIIARTPGQNHFNAKARGRARLAKGRSKVINMSNMMRGRFLPGK
tara:strand:- start:5337 stop:5522 length:186 start_codon:yes stop_codon:yes gene_type:complete